MSTSSCISAARAEQELHPPVQDRTSLRRVVVEEDEEEDRLASFPAACNLAQVRFRVVINKLHGQPFVCSPSFRLHILMHRRQDSSGVRSRVASNHPPYMRAWGIIARWLPACYLPTCYRIAEESRERQPSFFACTHYSFLTATKHVVVLIQDIHCYYLVIW